MSDLTYMQRKAIRRLGRGQTLSRSMMADPLIQKCYSVDHYERPSEDMNIVEWCDWEARARCQRPKLTEFGSELLRGLLMTGIPESGAAILRELHKRVPWMELESEFCQPSEHDVWESADGEMVCSTCTFAEPDYVTYACSECRDEDGERCEWPTATDRAIHQLPGDEE